MKNKKIFLIVLILISIILSGCITDSKSVEKTENPTNVTISDRQLLVNGEPFMVKSIGYSPVPIGKDPNVNREDYFAVKHSGIYNRDLPLLREMGATAIRIGWINTEDHTDFLNKAYNDGRSPIYIILNFWISPNADISSPSVREKLKSDFRKTVAKHKNHPAILMWSIGNELNAKWRWDKNKLNDLFSLLDEMALEAHLEEGDSYHPVTTTLVDAELIDTIRDYDPKMTNLDIWSVQLYRGDSFGTIFYEYSNVSSKPLIIMEFGADAFDDRNQTEQEDVQATYITSLWKEIEANSNVTVGGSITSYADQWWKARYAHRSDKFDCPDDDISYQSDCGYPLSSQPDGYTNEEWWGIMRIKDNGDKPNIVEPRKAYYAARELWTNNK